MANLIKIQPTLQKFNKAGATLAYSLHFMFVGNLQDLCILFFSRIYRVNGFDHGSLLQFPVVYLPIMILSVASFSIEQPHP